MLRSIQFLTFSVAVCFLFTHSTVSAATITVFDGVGAGDLRSDWEAAVGSFLEEDFNDGTADDFTLTPIGGGHSGFGISGGMFNDRLIPGSSTEIDFAAPILGFGGDWDLAGPGGPGLGIAIEAGGTVVPVEVPESHAGDFFGFTSDVAFTKIILESGTQGGGAETYDLDNVVYASSTSAVPEPSALALWSIVGMAGLGMARRRRMKALA